MKTVRILICLAIVLLGLILLLPEAAMADVTPTPTPTPESIEIKPTYPKMAAPAGSSLTFEVELNYIGDKPKVFDLQALPPKGWQVYVNPQYDTNTKISSIRLDPSAGYGSKINVVAGVSLFPLPDPGEYKISLTASSGTVKNSADLAAVVTTQYDLRLVSALDQPLAGTTQLNTIAQPGKDNFFAIKVQNLGTVPVDNIEFSSIKPDGWTVSFTPDKVDSLAAFDEKSVDVNFKPDAKAVAGDYIIGLSTSGTQTLIPPVYIRVTVESPSVWGWVGVGVIFLLVVGLIVGFMRFTRR